ncbi:hypothetical protein DTO280E4_6504 [Paecilomyces variotii]|nr:hypothetical protein DTO280E4_6504 [Paecilomyces variotii]
MSPNPPPTAQTIADINTLSHFLSSSSNTLPRATTSSSTSPTHPPIPPTDCIVICASAILHQAEILFSALSSNPNLTPRLVLCGGIGHSTKFMYEAVAKHPRFGDIAEQIKGFPEARVLERILDVFFNGQKIRQMGCEVLVEDESTNCGENAVKTRGVLEDAEKAAAAEAAAAAEIIQKRHHPRTFLIIQDPTMMLRTKASFEKAYQDILPAREFICFPTFVPEVKLSTSTSTYTSGSGSDSSEMMTITYSNTTPPPEGLWDFERFYDLIMGEIPRLRDDKEGYGPNGKGFITHVDVPRDVEEAWERLRAFRVGGR